MKVKILNCVSCGEKGLSKDTIGINKKLLGENIAHFYCMKCLADYLGCTIQDLNDKIEDLKEDGCNLFM